MANSAEPAKPGRGSHLRSVDIRVGAKILLRRTLLDMSLERLRDVFGISLLQVQTYERVLNRIGASRMFDISRMLKMPIAHFGENIPEGFSETLVRAGRYMSLS